MLKINTLQDPNARTVRSFVARGGRMTEVYRQALEELWPLFGLELTASKLDLKHIFGREAPVNLEIGFGDGRSLLQMALENPECNFIGIEVYKVGIAKLLLGIKKYNLTNIRVYCADAIEVLNNCLPDGSLRQVQLFFPDPWPKARHHKRRIVQPNFVNLVASKLKNDGRFHMATDWENYAQHMLAIMEQEDVFINVAGKGNFALRPSTRALTKFEQRGHRLGYGTWDLIFNKK